SPLDACQYWDKFYKMHQKKFFKDRKWLFLEFPELLPSGAKSQTTNGYLVDQQASHPQLTGSSTDTDTRIQQHNRPTHRNTDTPSHQKESCEILASMKDKLQLYCICNRLRVLKLSVLLHRETDAYVYCCDFSPCAIQLVKVNYHDSVCHAFVHDICEERASFPFPPQSLDVILAVFVLSSIHPERLQGIVNRLSTYLKYGGIFLFRDYGRFDFSQLRFKKGRCLSENFYTRGDGTCVYFFTKEEIHDLFSIAGLEEIQNLEDRRLQVNRGKKVAMHRVWMQSKYRKGYPPPPS
uniref:tRNA N(3)-cytidine methyltransferase n=1 Tax=Cyclopterus lumpus TaxID=8103 RepID=A0A8C3AW80_CYCLU